MQSILIQSEKETRDDLIAELWEYGTTGVVENMDSVEAFFENEAIVSRVVEHLAGSVLKVRQEPDRKEHAVVCPDRDPIYAGKQFFIVPSCSQIQTPPDRTRLEIDAIDAFGSGGHESTQLVIQVLEEVLLPDSTVLDVGCGSGILSAVAHHLGATQVFGCDTHLGALTCARRNSPESSFFAGSVDSAAPACADLVIVNIGTTIIDLLTDELHRITKPTGVLLLAGFTKERTPARIRPEKAFQLEGWLCWLSRPRNFDLNHLPQQSVQPFPLQWW